MEFEGSKGAKPSPADFVACPLSRSSRPVDTELGGMNALAAAAQVVAMSIDDGGAEDSVLEDALDASAADSIALLNHDDTGVDKENDGGLPEDGDQRAVDRKVLLRP